MRTCRRWSFLFQRNRPPSHCQDHCFQIPSDDDVVDVSNFRWKCRLERAASGCSVGKYCEQCRTWDKNLFCLAIDKILLLSTPKVVTVEANEAFFHRFLVVFFFFKSGSAPILHQELSAGLRVFRRDDVTGRLQPAQLWPADDAVRHRPPAARHVHQHHRPVLAGAPSDYGRSYFRFDYQNRSTGTFPIDSTAMVSGCINSSVDFEESYQKWKKLEFFEWTLLKRAPDLIYIIDISWIPIVKTRLFKFHLTWVTVPCWNLVRLDLSLEFKDKKTKKYDQSHSW